MNFIKAFNGALEKIALDENLNPTHVALYVALFHSWNQSRFKNPLSINREEIRRISKIGSNHTYHKCLWDLHHAGYVEYVPSYNPFKGSKVNLFNFDTSSEQVLPQYPTENSISTEQALPRSINGIKESKHKTVENEKMPPPKNEVLIFFQNEKYPEIEADKFYNYFQSNGWKVGGKTPMKDWQAAARNWMINAKKFNEQKNEKSNKLHTHPDKDYSEPL